MDERRGRDKAGVINFIFVFLLPLLRVNTIIQSRKVASFAWPFGAWCSPGGGKYEDSNELQREFLKHKQADRDTAGWRSPSLGSSEEDLGVDCGLRTRRAVPPGVCPIPSPPPSSHPYHS